MSWFKQRRQLLILVQKIMTLIEISYLFWFNCLSRKFNPLIPYSFSISSTVVNCFRHSHSYNIEIYFLTSEQGIKRARRRLKTAWTICNWFIFFPFFFIVEWSTNGTIIWNKTIKKKLYFLEIMVNLLPWYFKYSLLVWSQSCFYLCIGNYQYELGNVWRLACLLYF
jgi:hypothetical protein